MFLSCGSSTLSQVTALEPSRRTCLFLDEGSVRCEVPPCPPRTASSATGRSASPRARQSPSAAPPRPPDASSSCTSTTPGTCTGISASSWTVRSSPGRCPRAPLPTRPTSGWRWTLVHTPRAGANHWLLIKERDGHVDRGGTEAFPDDSIYSGLEVDDLPRAGEIEGELRSRALARGRMRGPCAPAPSSR